MLRVLQCYVLGVQSLPFLETSLSLLGVRREGLRILPALSCHLSDFMWLCIVIFNIYLPYLQESLRATLEP